MTDFSRAVTALAHISLMTNDIFNAHDELESRSGGPGEPVSVNGIPTLLYRFSDGSGLILAEHTDYAGNIHVWRKDIFPTLDALFVAMKSGDALLPCWSDLPTYGGSEPHDTEGIWSWDATRMIAGECAENLEIVTREGN